jgi:tRNA A37 threonylcarbamoyladenosine modification protein TsaB|tara:strand:- start:199 stop:576 length:378 start_codon:yes stop_codon:yes gene_type:complete
MNFLVIDGTQDKIIFFSKFNNNSYHKSITASKNNNEKLSMKLFEFFNENSIKLSELNNIFVNQGPGKFSGIRTSIAVAKALSITNKLNLYGFNSNDLKNMNYENVVNLCEKGALTKNLINPVYSS